MTEHVWVDGLLRMSGADYVEKTTLVAFSAVAAADISAQSVDQIEKRTHYSLIAFVYVF